MTKFWRVRQILAGFFFLLLLLETAGAADSASQTIVWQAAEKKLDANIRAYPLKKVLGKLSAATGWRIYIEPGSERPITARFNGRPAGEGLGLLLSDLNFALVPGSTNGSPKLLIYKTSASQATQIVQAPENKAGHGQPIPNELVVTLNPNGRDSIDNLAKRLGATVAGRIDGLHSYRLQFKDEAAAQAARDYLSNQSYGKVDSNYALDRPEAVQEPVSQAGRSLSLKPKPTGKDSVVVALLDTPLQPLDGKMNDFLLPAIHVAGAPPAELPNLMHGTTMAETILNGVAAANPHDTAGSPVRILPVDVYGSSDSTTTFDIAHGIFAAVGQGATIINLSLGSEQGDSRFLQDVIQQAHKNGVVFFGAAGNEPTTAPVYPAAYPEVVAVTAGDRPGHFAPYANRGDFVAVMAPGTSLVHFNGEPYLVTGTSAATAYVSGSAAGFEALGKSLPEVETLIRTQLPVPKKD